MKKLLSYFIFILFIKIKLEKNHILFKSRLLLYIGAPGLSGEVGRKGAIGHQGPMANATRDGFLFTKHSQKVNVPACPNGSRRLYDGYSLLFIHGNNRGHGQDLGMKRSQTYTQTLTLMNIPLEHKCVTHAVR